MKLMTAEEIAELQREFENHIDETIKMWAIRCVTDIEAQIEAKNTGAESVFEGYTQIMPYCFYVNEDLSNKIRASKKSFHGGTVSERMLDEFLIEDYWAPAGKIYLFNDWFLNPEQLKSVIDASNYRLDRYMACVFASLDTEIVEEQKGFIFKRMVKKERYAWKFKGISLRFLRAFDEACRTRGIELVGAAVAFYDTELQVKLRVDIMDDIYGSYIFKDKFGTTRRATLLKWRYTR